MQSSDIASLVNSIKEANQLYRIGNPRISDTEYDNLVDLLRSEIGEDRFEEFRKTLTEKLGKIKHPYAMGSLEKIKAFDDSCSIKDWILKHIPDNGDGSEGIFVSSKIDGCSARVTYANGKLIGCSTRGNGEYGVDIFSKAILFIPTELDSKFSGDIRGEITLTHETFEELQKYTGEEYKNLRNTTAGLINAKNSHDDTAISFLRFFPYEIMGDNGFTKKEQFSKLKKLGFTTALYVELTDIYNDTVSSYDDALLNVYNKFLVEAPYDIDGLVVSDLNDTEVFENKFIPLNTVAVKFNQLTATSTLINIEWNISKNGDLRPVGMIEPVNLGGAEVSAVTLNNLNYIKEYGLKYGCSVTILKSGDIIPKLVSVSHPNVDCEQDIDYPQICPSCGSALEYSEDCLYPHCPNKMCDEILYNKILHFLKHLEIKHLSLKTIEKFDLKSISDIMNLKNDGGAVKSKFIKDVDSKMFGADKAALLMAFDYNGVSSLIIEKMIAHYGYDKLLSSTADELKKDMPYGVGEKFIDKFINGYSEIKDEYQAILNDSRYHGNDVSHSTENAVIDGVLKGQGFVVTGSLKKMNRKQFQNIVIANGGKYCSSITKATNYLVTNETTMTTKMKKALLSGVKIINEEEFNNLLHQGDNFSIF
jgi:DNA ligase (NAD+)